MEQLNLWDFIPESEDGKTSPSYLYFNENADKYLLHYDYGCANDQKVKQLDIFDFLNLSIEEILLMTNLEFTSDLEDKEFYKFVKNNNKYVMIAFYLCHKHGWVHNPVEINLCQDSVWEKLTFEYSQTKGKKKEPQNSFFNHESRYLKGVKKMLERRNPYGKNNFK